MSRRSILLVEDSASDVMLAREALRGVAVDLTVAVDGEEALARLRSAPPDLVLLDLNLPRKNGLELLTELRFDPRLRRLPVIMLTTSSSERDVTACYEQGANCYVVKPLGIDEFAATITAICDFWFGFARLPEREVSPSEPTSG